MTSQVNYCNIDDNGTLRLIPDDSPLLDNHSITIPDFNELAHNCKSLLPSQSCDLLKQGLTILHLNARSMHQSYHDIVTLVTSNAHSSHFILVSETWLDSGLVNGFQLPGYEMMHSVPEQNFIGRGCAMYVRNDIFPFCKKLDDLCAKETEYQCIFVEIACPGKPRFLVGTTYRSPSYPLAQFLPYLESTLNNISSSPKTCFWGGDWNLNLFQYNSRSDVKIFLDCLNSYGFFPTITIPTRVSSSPHYSETLIDNIFTNSVNTVLNNCTISCGIADHQAVFCSSSIVNYDFPRASRMPACRKFNYSKIHEVKINLSNKLVEFNNLSDPEEACEVLVTTIQNEIDRCSSASLHRRTEPIQPWVTPAILRSINMRNVLLKKFLQERSAESESKFKKYRNILRLTLRHAKILSKSV